MIINQSIDGRNEDGLSNDLNIIHLYNIKRFQKSRYGTTNVWNDIKIYLID